MFWENNSFLLSVISDIIHYFAAKFKYNSKNVELYSLSVNSEVYF